MVGERRMRILTEMTEASDCFDLDGNSILVESDDNEHIFISGFEVNNFTTDDKDIDFISLMGNNLVSTVIANGKKYHVLHIWQIHGKQ